jgi:hypothetical protein
VTVSDCLGYLVARDRQHVAEAGDEHRVVDRRRDRIASPGQKRGRNRAAAGGSAVLIAPIAKPDAPMPEKNMSRPKS